MLIKNEVRLSNNIVCDKSWIPKENEIIMIRDQSDKWHEFSLQYRFGRGLRRDGKERDNWFVICNETTISIVFDYTRQYWVSAQYI